MKCKETPKGRVPEDWNIETLDRLTDINKESRDPQKTSPESKFLYIDIESIGNESGIINSSKEILGKEAPSRARRVVHVNDVIMSTVRPYLKAFALVPEEYDNQICSTGFAVLSSKGNLVPKYLLYSLFSSTVINQCNRMMMGGQYPALNTSQVKKIKIYLPPLPEQQKIAEILSTTDQAIHKSNEIIAKTENLKRGIMQKLLTEGIGHEEFKDTPIGRIPKDWNIERLGKITQVTVGHVGPISQYYTNGGNGVPLLSTTNISNNGMDCKNLKFVSKEFDKKHKKSKVYSNDLIIARHGASGSASLVPDELNEAQSLNVVIVRASKNFDSKYLESLFNYGLVKARLAGWKSGSVQGVVNTRVLEKFRIPIPNLTEQKKIVSIVSSIDEKYQFELKRNLKLKNIKKCLMNDLLTGRKRVQVNN